jgi:hypothetical protein
MSIPQRYIPKVLSNEDRNIQKKYNKEPENVSKW